MKSPSHAGHCYEFSFPRLGTMILVEELPGEVVIRATRNTFSEARKLAFVRALAQEGFIADEYGWATGGLPARVRWLVDGSWLTPHSIGRTRRSRLARRLLAGGIAAWIALTGFVYFHRR